MEERVIRVKTIAYEFVVIYHANGSVINKITDCKFVYNGVMIMGDFIVIMENLIRVNAFEETLLSQLRSIEDPDKWIVVLEEFLELSQKGKERYLDIRKTDTKGNLFTCYCSGIDDDK
jgi:hypothetical protein